MCLGDYIEGATGNTKIEVLEIEIPERHYNLLVLIAKQNQTMLELNAHIVKALSPEHPLFVMRTGGINA